MSILANRYAEGFFALASQENKVALYKEQIDFVKKCLDESNAVEFFKSYKVSKVDKKNLIKDNFKDLDEYVLNFLNLLVDKNRMAYYDEIFVEFHKLCNDSLKIKEGVIETARDLDDKLIKELEDNLSDDSYKVVLMPRINKSLISGFRIILDDKIIDNTMKQRIKNMEEILKRKDGVYGA